MKMNSKCHKDLLMKEEQAKVAASFITKGSSSTNMEQLLVDVQVNIVEPKRIYVQLTCDLVKEEKRVEAKPKEGPSPHCLMEFLIETCLSMCFLRMEVVWALQFICIRDAASS